MTEKKKIRKDLLIMAVLLILMIIANAAAVLIPKAADIYADNVFPVISGIFSAVSGIIPFSFGELLIAVGIIALAALPVLLIISAVKKSGKLLKFTGLFYGWVMIYIIVTETLNCFVLYRTTDFSVKFHHNAGAQRFEPEQLSELLEEVVLEANKLSGEVSRDEKGDMIVPDNMRDIAERSMNILAEEYPNLGGHCPKPKKIRSAIIMTQTDLQGIYFPFTLEANYNSALSPARVPCTQMHELSHVKGFIREDEACFIACRACFESDVPEVRYSGYLSAMNYLFGEAKKNLSHEEWLRLGGLIDDKVRRDNTFVSEEYLKYIEKKAVVPTETAKEVSSKAMDTTLKVGGVSDGKQSYNRMVTLLMEYRFYISGEPYP